MAKPDVLREVFNSSESRTLSSSPDIWKRTYLETVNKFTLVGGSDLRSFFPYYREEMADFNGVKTFDSQAQVGDGEWSQEEADFHQRLMKLDSSMGMELRRGNLGGLEMLTAMITLHDNPDMYFTDMKEERYSRQRIAAGRRVLNALEEMETHPEKLSQLLADAMVAYANIDPKKEVLHVLGKDENMSGDAAEAEMKKPENVITVSAVLTSFSKMNVGAGQIMRAAVDGRKSPLTSPFEDDGLEDSEPARTVYAGMRRRLSEKEWKECMETMVRIDLNKMLGVFTQQSKLALTPGAPFTTKDLVAMDQAVSVIAHNGPLRSIPKEQTRGIFRTQTLVDRFGIELNGEQIAARLAYGMDPRERETLKTQREAMDWKPVKPKELSGWVRFWSRFNFYQERVADYEREMKRYEAIISRQSSEMNWTELEEKASQLMDAEMERRQTRASKAVESRRMTPEEIMNREPGMMRIKTTDDLEIRRPVLKPKSREL